MATPTLKSLLAAACLLAADAAHWAVIMAGSNGYYNYRHQADACHAYQVAKRNGIPESNIILLSYDDVANDNQNPFPGKLFNHPNGTDVYAGCHPSYKGEAVTAQNFLKVLQGDSSSPGPVLKSTSEDRVFVYYVDHGSLGILGVPSGEWIDAADLNHALVSMHAKGMYQELLFYVEACESGSIFEGLITAPKVKAVTAANPHEPSWGFYCPPLDMVNGKAIGACLGDQFSINWMEDTERAALGTETLGQQLATVTLKTNKSHVSQYGDNSFDSEAIGNFVGTQGASRDMFSAVAAFDDGSAVESRDIDLHVAYWAVRRATFPGEKQRAEAELLRLLVLRQEVDAKFQRVALAAAKFNETEAHHLLHGPRDAVTQPECHKVAMHAAAEFCGTFTDYSLRYSRLLANLCESTLGKDAVVAVVRQGCGKESEGAFVV